MAPALLQAAALALRAASITCPASPTCPQDDGCSYTANAVSFQVSCGTDYYGGDLELAHTSTVAACMDTCSAITSCVAASYVSGNCYIKSSLNAGGANANVIGVAVTSRETPATTPPVGAQESCPSSFTCPENNGCLYTDGSRTLALSCGTDFYGGDFASQYATNLEACMQTCAAKSECVAASFVGGKGAGTCYLKSTKNKGSINDNVHGIYVVTASAGPSSPVTPIASTTMSSTLSAIVTSTETSIGLISVTPSPSVSSAAVSSSSASSTDSPSSKASSMTDASSTAPSTSSLVVSSVVSTTVTSTPEITTSAASSTQSVSSSTITSSDMTSSAGLPSSIIASVSAVSPTSSPTPTTAISDGDFEATNSGNWLIRNRAAGALTYSFANPNDPHGGSQAASVSYSAGASAYQAWFYQPINLLPNTRYTLSAWTKASTANPGCSVSYYIGTADGNQVSKIMATITSANLRPVWVQSTGFYDSAGGAFTFNVRFTCAGSAARTYYIDDISLVPSA